MQKYGEWFYVVKAFQKWIKSNIIFVALIGFYVQCSTNLNAVSVLVL